MVHAKLTAVPEGLRVGVLFFSLNLDDTMWFRNLRAYRLPERLGLDAEAMAQR